MGHASWMLDQGLDSTERLTQRENLGASANIDGRLFTPCYPEGDHSTEVAHLPPRHLVTWMLRKAGPKNLTDCGVTGEEVNNRSCVGAMPIHPNAERLDTAQHQPGIERPRNGAHGVLMECQSLTEVGVSNDQRSTDDVAMPTEVLGGRVDHNVRTQ